MGRVLGIVAAVLAHAVFLLFGGIFLPRPDEQVVRRDIELVGAEDPEHDKPPEPEQPPEPEPPQEQPPDASEILTRLEAPTPSDGPALDAASLSAMEQALNGGGGGWGDGVSFASGGTLGATGRGGAIDDSMDKAFSLAEIDQKPRAVYQSAPMFPTELRGRKIEGLVTVLFVVNPAGKVIDPRVEKASHPAFQKPALDAIRLWRFEAAVKGGQRVACRMRVPIRFQPS
jgi:periplasmic protein TonB